MVSQKCCCEKDNYGVQGIRINKIHMKTLLNKKNILAVTAGILFAGLILNTVEQISPKQVISTNQALYLESGEEVVRFIDSNEIKERILEEAVSTKAQDSETLRKVENIRTYFERRNAPLSAYAKELVEAANKYGIDYRLVAAISIIESGGGIHNFRTYNAWGWGKMNFSSWEEGIDKVSAGLGRYYSRGLNTPQKIAPYYCPPNATEWARKVTFVMGEIEK